MEQNRGINNVTKYIVCVSGHDPLIFSFLSFLLFDWVGVGPAVSLFPQRPCRGRLFAVAAGVHVFISGESLSVVIFLWLVILLFLIDVNNVTMFTTCLDFGS